MKLSISFSLLYLAFFFPILGFGQENKATLEAVEYLKQHPKSPKDYLVSKFKNYPLVLLVEDHAVKENNDGKRLQQK